MQVLISSSVYHHRLNLLDSNAVSDFLGGNMFLGEKLLMRVGDCESRTGHSEFDKMQSFPGLGHPLQGKGHQYSITYSSIT